MRTFSFTFLGSRDRLNRKGETARSLEDCCKTKIDLMGVLPFEYLMFFPFMDTPCSLSRMIEVLKELEESSS